MQKRGFLWLAAATLVREDEVRRDDRENDKHSGHDRSPVPTH